MSARIQIIGGGLLGLASAYALVERGITDIRILEARDGIAQGTSFANAGMVHASLADPWNSPGVGAKILKSILAPSPAMALKFSALPSLRGWGRAFLRNSQLATYENAARQNYMLAAHSLALIEDWQNKVCPKGYIDGKGLLKIYRNQCDFKMAINLSQNLGAQGLKYKVLTKDEVPDYEPALSAIKDQLVGALYYPDDFKADAYIFCQGLADELKRRGVDIRTHTPIEQLMCETGKCVGARYKDKAYYADMTIIAAGARSANLLKTVGVALPVRPVKGYSLTFGPVGSDTSFQPDLPVVDETLHAAITPLGDKVRIAGTAQIAGFNAQLKPKDLKPLFGMLHRVYPKIAEGLTLETAQAWCGFRPVSADGMPFIGITKIPGLALNTGHGHMGWTSCAGSADMLADILQGQITQINDTAFSAQKL